MTKKIFITIPWFLPAFRAGGPIQSIANLVKEFREGVEYYIFCSNTDLNGAALEDVETGKWARYNECTQVWYAKPAKISDALVKQVEKISPDYLYIIGLFSWHYNMVPMIFCKGPVKILSTRGMLHPGALSQKKWKKKIYLQLFKLLEYHHSIRFHATNEEEQKYISQQFGQPAKVFVAGNFPNKVPPLPVVEKVPGALKLISVGIISPMKNILSVLQALALSTAYINYDIYGPIKDWEYWDLCKEKIKSLPENIKVNYKKEIEPQKVPEILSKAHVFILPSKSENFGHAIYEALSAGRPVITGTSTPWNHLYDAKAGMNVIPDNLNELFAAIDFFVAMSHDTLSQWTQGAVAYADKAIDMEKIKEDYEKIFLRAI